MKMKNLFLVSVLFFVLAVSTINAQTYSINKLKYDSHMYIPQFGDPYRPALSGACSFIMPGLGQMISGEVGRGLGFLGGSAACGLVGTLGYVVAVLNAYSGDSQNAGFGVGMMVVGYGGMLALDIWSIVDAVNVAKVNNMYIQSLRKSSSINLEVTPFISQISVNNKIEMPVGLSLRVRF